MIGFQSHDCTSTKCLNSVLFSTIPPFGPIPDYCQLLPETVNHFLTSSLTPLQPILHDTARRNFYLKTYLLWEIGGHVMDESEGEVTGPLMKRTQKV